MNSAEEQGAPPASSGLPPLTLRIYRHSLPVRLTHWINALAMLVLLLSGLQIFNAHPALYWGKQSDFERPLLAMRAGRAADGTPIGLTTVFGHSFETTGIFGVSKVNGLTQARGFPAWLTLPGVQWLAQGRRWHFFFAWVLVLNGLAYTAYALWRRHLQRDLLPTKADLKTIGRTVAEHVRLKFPEGEAARHYNVLQKLAYVGVVFGLGPLVVLTGLTMSPAMNTAFPFLLDLFGGRQSARTIHFVCAFGFVLFFIAHIVMVILSGLRNNLRSMLTGWYAIKITDITHDTR